MDDVLIVTVHPITTKSRNTKNEIMIDVRFYKRAKIFEKEDPKQAEPFEIITIRNVMLYCLGGGAKVNKLTSQNLPGITLYEVQINAKYRALCSFDDDINPQKTKILSIFDICLSPECTENAGRICHLFSLPTFKKPKMAYRFYETRKAKFCF
jgi:hypothetical protein